MFAKLVVLSLVLGCYLRYQFCCVLLVASARTESTWWWNWTTFRNTVLLWPMRNGRKRPIYMCYFSCLYMLNSFCQWMSADYRRIGVFPWLIKQLL